MPTSPRITSPRCRVLQKCGFEIAGEDKGFANAHGQEVEEYILIKKKEVLIASDIGDTLNENPYPPRSLQPWTCWVR